VKRSRKVLLCIVASVVAYLAFTPSAELTIRYRYGVPLAPNGSIPPGITSTLTNLRPFPISTDLFICDHWIKVWNAKGKLITDKHDIINIPLCNPSAPISDFDRHTQLIPPFSQGDIGGFYPLSEILPPVPDTPIVIPATYTVQIGIGSIESNKLTVSFPETHILSK
jgi:hypothetical protein